MGRNFVGPRQDKVRLGKNPVAFPRGDFFQSLPVLLRILHVFGQKALGLGWLENADRAEIAVLLVA